MRSTSARRDDVAGCWLGISVSCFGTVDNINNTLYKCPVGVEDSRLFPGPLSAMPFLPEQISLMQRSPENTPSNRADLPPLPIYSMLCSTDVDRALLCFDTLYRRCRDRFQLTVLDDGSLSVLDRDRLMKAFGEMKILSKEEREDRVMPRLRGKPNCLRFRDEHIFSLKLLDGPLLGTGAFGLCDSDMYFVRNVTGVDRRAIATDDLVFMLDWCSGYTLGFLKRFLGATRCDCPRGSTRASSTSGRDRMTSISSNGSSARLISAVPEPAARSSWSSKLPGLLWRGASDPATSTPRRSPSRQPSGLSPIALPYSILRASSGTSSTTRRSGRAVEELPKADGEAVAQLQSRPAIFDGLMKGTIKRLYRKLVSGPEVAPWATLSAGR